MVVNICKLMNGVQKTRFPDNHLKVIRWSPSNLSQLTPIIFTWARGPPVIDKELGLLWIL